MVRFDLIVILTALNTLDVNEVSALKRRRRSSSSDASFF